MKSSLALVVLLSACGVAPDVPEHYGTTSQATGCSFDCDDIPMQGEHLLGASIDALRNAASGQNPMFSVGLNGYVDGTTVPVQVELLDDDVGLRVATNGAPAITFTPASRVVLPAITPNTGELRITWGKDPETATIQQQQRTAYFYTVEWRADPNDPNSPYLPMCDGDYAIPLYGDYTVTRQHKPDGDRITFACLTGVAAKCVMWHYLPGKIFSLEPTSPWQVHQACTRLANNDLCATGIPHTREGTEINIFDTVGVRAAPPDTFFGVPRWPPPHDRMYFEAGWRGDKKDPPFVGKAQVPVCLSKLRWSTLPPDPTNPFCPSGDLGDPRNAVMVETCDDEIGFTGFYWPYVGEARAHFEAFRTRHSDTVLFTVSRYNELAMMPWSNGSDKVTTIDGYIDADLALIKHPYTATFNPDPVDVEGTLLRQPYGTITEGVDYVRAYLWRSNGDRVIAPEGVPELTGYIRDSMVGYLYTSSYAQNRNDMAALYLYKQKVSWPFVPGFTSSTKTALTDLSKYQRGALLGYLRTVTPRE